MENHQESQTADAAQGVAAAIQQLQNELMDTTARFGRAVVERDRAREDAQRHANNATILQERLDAANANLHALGERTVPGLGEAYAPEVSGQESFSMESSPAEQTKA